MLTKLEGKYTRKNLTTTRIPKPLRKMEEDFYWMRKEELDLPKKKLEEERDLVLRKLEEELDLSLRQMEEELNSPNRELEEELNLPDRKLEEELDLSLKKMEEEIILLLEYNFDNNITPENQNVKKDELPESKNVGKEESLESKNVGKDELPENQNVKKDELSESKNVGKDESLESKNVGKDELPENENVEKDELSESKNVEKDELPENKNVGKDESPERKNVGKDELFPEFRLHHEPIFPEFTLYHGPIISVFVDSQFDSFWGYNFFHGSKKTILNVGTEEAGANQEKVKKQKASGNYRPFSPGTTFFGTVVLIYLISSCTAESIMSDGPNKQQDLSEIYQHTLKKVENCPNVNEYRQRAFGKCADVCGANMQDGKCAYHCMRDSSKTNLYEFCAKPEPLFDYCPEFDPVDQTIQKDHETRCNSSFSRRIYNSSEIFFCDPGSCLKLTGIESTVRTFPTTTAPNTTKTDMKSRDVSLFYITAALVLGLCILVICHWTRDKCLACLKKLVNFKSPSNADAISSAGNSAVVYNFYRTS